MKKTIAGFMLILGMGIGVTQANAQSTTFGIKADANMSNFILSDMGGVKSNMGIGASLGGFAKYDISERFAIQPELLVHYQTSETKQGGAKLDYEYWGLEIPVYAMFQWENFTNNRFYAGIGPYVGYGLDARYTNTTPKTKLYKDDLRQPWDFGFGAQVGYEFANGIQINAGYKIGIVDALDKGKDDATMLPQRISLGIGYRF